jgi:phosphopantothenoylcysteine decarboxylase / phosphopantothenate---cysteine ligase
MKVVVAVTGSVAALRTPELVREMKRRGYAIECVMSESAFQIINPKVLEWASGEKVITELGGAVEHVRLLGIDGEADALLISPSTSNTICKIASGIDDTPVTTMAATALGSGKKVLIAPAMHESMYRNPFVSENIKKLENAGVSFIGPNISEGKAKIASEEEIISTLDGVLR